MIRIDSLMKCGSSKAPALPKMHSGKSAPMLPMMSGSHGKTMGKMAGKTKY